MTKARHGRLKFGSVADSLPASEALARQNLEAAKLILQRAAPGAGGLAIEWARKIVEQAGQNDHDRALGDHQQAGLDFGDGRAS
jgi:hypothetical protein